MTPADHLDLARYFVPSLSWLPSMTAAHPCVPSALSQPRLEDLAAGHTLAGWGIPLCHLEERATARAVERGADRARKLIRPLRHSIRQLRKGP